ncbi:hypothetical protein FUAX_52840 (plasmid) [Fulvitalea axinellae]|uniref:Uncharacterized protein n=1 Tax=Fulvitalea axinellae TaxID=1182444 RepID=A0AAU9CYJ9_9BACT|nr:hypothetical protein FUAX_52840 [Fulvitalea axinellae]
MKMNRIVIYPKDIQAITGKSESGARRELVRIREKLGKASHQYVTVEEFCQYCGLSLESIRKLLNI